ncbi:hypothetical protein SAY87_006091 [Trapa incisa]|uniref:BTB domain-containing protein n=1 Tax=Trapa incisa TaxID=236973 RepID=A0AAN7KB01_9MYRT|nr:hypothetical protein SAY87_006091 [Trapa incisa]
MWCRLFLFGPPPLLLCSISFPLSSPWISPAPSVGVVRQQAVDTSPLRRGNHAMMHGRNNGKKLMAVRIVKHAMEIIHLLTEANPIQLAFLMFWFPVENPSSGSGRFSALSFSDVVPVSSDESWLSAPVPAHRAVLANRSPVFKAMLENEMTESKSRTIKIDDVSYEALRAFVNFMYMAEACMDEQLASRTRPSVPSSTSCTRRKPAWTSSSRPSSWCWPRSTRGNTLKSYCEKFLESKLN